MYEDGCSSFDLAFAHLPTSEAFDGEVDVIPSSAQSVGNTAVELTCLTEDDTDTEAEGQAIVGLPFTRAWTDSCDGSSPFRMHGSPRLAAHSVDGDGNDPALELEDGAESVDGEADEQDAHRLRFMRLRTDSGVGMPVWDASPAHNSTDGVNLTADPMVHDFQSTFGQGNASAPAQLSNGFGANFDGVWISGEDTFKVAGGGALFEDGNVYAFKATSATACELVQDGDTFKGTLQLCGKIIWNDGDVWSRCNVSPALTPVVLSPARVPMQAPASPLRLLQASGRNLNVLEVAAVVQVVGRTARRNPNRCPRRQRNKAPTNLPKQPGPSTEQT